MQRVIAHLHSRGAGAGALEAALARLPRVEGMKGLLAALAARADEGAAEEVAARACRLLLGEYMCAHLKTHTNLLPTPAP